LFLTLICAGISLLDFTEIAALADGLEVWFVNLFQGDAPAERGLLLSIAHFDRGRVNLLRKHLPSLVSTALKLGEQVTRHSAHPEQAAAAFYEALALDLLLQTISMEDRLEYIYESLLLD
jgi:hypothetical protein